MTPPATVHTVPNAVIVLGWTPRRTSQSATGSMTLRYPFLSQSGRIFMRLRVCGGRLQNDRYTAVATALLRA